MTFIVCISGVCSYLYSVLCVSGFVNASFTDGEGAHADVFLQYIAITEQQVFPVQLLQRKSLDL